MLAGQCQLGRRQRHPVRDRAKPAEGMRVAASGGAQQLPRLAAKLADVGAAGKLGHDVSSRPRLACGRRRKTTLPNRAVSYVEGDSGPAREPGGALPRRCRQHMR